MSVRSPRTRSLWPREHGAYAQLLVPLATALAATAPSWAGAAIALGAGLAFLASEPLRVVLGDRGSRMRDLAGTRARRRLALVATAAMIAGGLGLALAPRSALWLTLLIAPPIGFVVVASWRGTVHGVVGESVAAVALAGAAAPVAVAGGMTARDALVMWGAWSLAYATTVVAVHHVIARHRSARSPADVRRGIAIVVQCAALAALIQLHPAAWFAAPLVVVAGLVGLVTPPATRLRAIGIAFLASSIAAALCAIATVR